MKNRRFHFILKQIRHFNLSKPKLLTISIAAIFVGALVLTAFLRSRPMATTSFLCSLSGGYITPEAANYAATPTQLLAILHYATSRAVPQQSIAEITVSFNVLKSLSPCNFLVFGLGHDSLMWASFNPRGTTLFLEEDPKWVQTVLSRSPFLRAFSVNYRTQLSEADELLAEYKSEDDCFNLRLRDNARCKLALTGLPDEVYDKEWDAIMIDAPRGYFDEAPGRMSAIFASAVMARGRTRRGVTHVFLHDVNRRVEKVYAEEFLCMKYMVEGVGRLWHFEIPPGVNMTAGSHIFEFC